MKQPRLPSVSRRQLLAGGALTAGAGLAGAGLAGAGLAAALSGDEPETSVRAGQQVEPFHGARQAGIETPAQAHGTFLGFDLRPGVDRPALGRLMRLLTDDARRLTQGTPALADVQPELAELPSRLTITFGFGPGFFAAAQADDAKPPSIRPLPSFDIDRLDPQWTGGDLLVQLCADDPMTLSHAQRIVVNDAQAFAALRWVQAGFHRGRAIQDDGVTQRNIFGQLDGTRNPRPGTPAFDAAVWIDDGPAWLRGGTTLVLRRIRAELPRWDAADSAAKEYAVGRFLATGAPLTGTQEHDEPDFDAKNGLGFTVIPEFSHIARARVASDRQRIFRRPYNFDVGPSPAGIPDAGLLFASYQRDIEGQFLPIQQRLAEIDLLNEWTTPIGSAVFAIPPGCADGGWIGESLLS